MKLDNTLSRISRIRESANKIIVEELERRGYSGLAPSHGDIIATLLFKGELTKTEISNQIHRDRSTVTVLIRKLETLGYVATRTHNEDNRSKIVYLTQKGREVNRDFFEISQMLYARQYQGMTQEQIKVFREALELVYRNYAE